MEPQRFGRYEIRAEVGRGGMATVYHAYDPRFGREVAIKVLPREMLHDLQFRIRFEREAKTIAMLEHPAIVPVYDFGEEDGQPFFVMRYMTGGSLSDRMKKGPLSVAEAARLMAHIASGLDEAHAKGIIHRDLKPGNILFDQFNEPYISDFGIAKLSEAQTNMTGSAIVGTPAYMSPEQAQGEGIDGRSDIYGLGVILFEMLTGQQPYHGDTPMSVVIKQITDPLPHILDYRPDLPADIDTIIKKSMAKDRNERFQDVKSLAEALNKVARGERLSPATSDATILASPDATILATPKTVVQAKRSPQPVVAPPARSQPLPGSVVVKKAQVAEIPMPAEVPAARPRKAGGTIGLVAGLLVLVVVAGGFFLFRDKLPFLAALLPKPTPTQTLAPATPTTAQVPPAATAAAVSQPAATDTAAPAAPSPSATTAPSPTATAPGLASLGGADLIAFLSNKDIWVMNVDGSGLQQLTKDSAIKQEPQWAHDGKSLYYISGKCIQNATYPEGVVSILTCFNSASYLDAFEISPDGTQVAISLEHVVFVVPFDTASLSAAKSWAAVKNMKGIFTYIEPPKQSITQQVRWSKDGKRIAINVVAADTGGLSVEKIYVYDLSSCTTDNPCNTTIGILDVFPGLRFTMQGYGTGSGRNSHIPSYAWDGENLFLLNSIIRNGTYGYLYSYNLSSQQGKMEDPAGSQCCYTDARWSPDGSYVLFSYQDIGQGSSSRNQLYYIPFGSFGTGTKMTPMTLPDSILASITDHPDPALRPVR